MSIEWFSLGWVSGRKGIAILEYFRWEVVNLEKGFPLVQSHPEDSYNPKNYEIRTIKLNCDAMLLLRQLRSNFYPDIPYVFPNRFGGPRKNNLSRDLRQVLKEAGVINKGGWHCAGRTFASHLVMRGTCLKTIQELLGHKSLRMTMKYAHLSEEYKQNAVL